MKTLISPTHKLFLHEAVVDSVKHLPPPFTIHCHVKQLSAVTNCFIISVIGISLLRWWIDCGTTHRRTFWGMTKMTRAVSSQVLVLMWSYMIFNTESATSVTCSNWNGLWIWYFLQVYCRNLWQLGLDAAGKKKKNPPSAYSLVLKENSLSPKITVTYYRWKSAPPLCACAGNQTLDQWHWWQAQ